MATGYYYPPAEDKGGVNFTLAPGDYLVGCPYDESHRALNTRYDRNLDKCRRNYAFKQALKGEDVITLSCQNQHHVVPAQELLLHEHICGREIRAKRSHDISIRLEEIRSLREEVKRTGVEQNEKLKALINVTPPLGEWPNMDVVVKGVTWADPKIAKAKGKSPFSKKLLAENFKSSSYGPRKQKKVGAKLDWYTKGPGATLDYSKGPLPPQPHELAMTKSKFDEEEDWDKGNTQPAYDWMKNFKTLDIPLLTFPPGLSKSQRKLFVIKNEERVKTQMGWFVSEPESDQNSIHLKVDNSKSEEKEESS